MQKVLVLHDFMLADKKLKGSRLLVYALIYSYSQIPNSDFYCNYEKASRFLGISKSSYFEALKWLVDNNYIISNYDSSDLHCSIRRFHVDTFEHKSFHLMPDSNNPGHHIIEHQVSINENKVSDLSQLCRNVWSKLLNK